MAQWDAVHHFVYITGGTKRLFFPYWFTEYGDCTVVFRCFYMLLEQSYTWLHGWLDTQSPWLHQYKQLYVCIFCFVCATSTIKIQKIACHQSKKRNNKHQVFTPNHPNFGCKILIKHCQHGTSNTLASWKNYRFWTLDDGHNCTVGKPLQKLQKSWDDPPGFRNRLTRVAQNWSAYLGVSWNRCPFRLAVFRHRVHVNIVAGVDNPNYKFTCFSTSTLPPICVCESNWRRRGISLKNWETPKEANSIKEACKDATKYSIW